MTAAADNVVSLEHYLTRDDGQPSSPALPAAPGVTVSDITGLAKVHGLFGGPGTARWKALLPGTRKTVEYVELPPGAGCGRQLGAPVREELYYIVGGTGTMTVNDQLEIPVKAGDLVACPVWTLHGIRAGAGAPMAYLVVKVPPAIDPPPRDAKRVPLAPGLDWTAGYWGEAEVSEVSVTADSLANLTGPWRRVTLIEIPPGTAIGPHDLPAGVSAVLFVTSGSAAVTAGTVTEEGGTGLFVSTPPRARCQIRNLSSSEPLGVVLTEVSA